MITLTTFLFLQTVLGADYCSSNKDHPVECVQCPGGCPLTNSSCDSSTYAFCPNQCGHTIPEKECSEVCGDKCHDGRCEYSSDLVVRCTGCQPEFTGQTCKEFCPSQCYECDQYNSTCITCKGNFLLPNCSDAKLVITTLAIKLNCSSKCRHCNDLSGDCIECLNGTYGDKCEYTCTHCKISLCGLDVKCSDCIRSLSSSQCPALTDKETVPRLTDTSVALICGLVAVLFLMFGIIGIWRKLSSRYRLRCEDIAMHYGNSNSESTLAVNHRYVCIDDNDLDPYYSGLNNSRTRPVPCPAKDHSRTVGNKDENQDGEDGSSLSSTSDTIFGNLFEIITESHESDNIAERQPNQDELNDYESVYEYEKHSLSYLTPASPVTSARSDNP